MPPALWSSQNVFGPPTMVAMFFDFKDWASSFEQGRLTWRIKQAGGDMLAAPKPVTPSCIDF